jgi:hypothetical protein
VQYPHPQHRRNPKRIAKNSDSGYFILKGHPNTETPRSSNVPNFHGKTNDGGGSTFATPLIEQEKRLGHVMAITDFQVRGIQARAGTLTPTRYVQAEKRQGHRNHEPGMTRRIDNTLEDSFPASDPPSWTPGVARPAPVRTGGGGVNGNP